MREGAHRRALVVIVSQEASIGDAVLTWRKTPELDDFQAAKWWGSRHSYSSISLLAIVQFVQPGTLGV